MVYNKIELKNHFDFIKEDENPVLEIYLPYNMKEMHRENNKRPCLVVLPGGGYSMCSERESEPIALRFLPAGYNVFVLTYSVVPKKFPTQLREVAAAMELIYENADKWNCDTSKIAIMGFSAGGHLAAHYSTMFDCKEVREVLPESKCVNASVLCYPVISADMGIAHQGSIINVIGHEPENIEEENYFSCNKCVSDKTPPAFLWHTADDTCVPVQNSFLYAQALISRNIPVEMHIYPFGNHGLSTCDKETCDNVTTEIAHNARWIDDCIKWLELIWNKA